jgi:hypothetical protein
MSRSLLTTCVSRVYDTDSHELGVRVLFSTMENQGKQNQLFYARSFQCLTIGSTAFFFENVVQNKKSKSSIRHVGPAHVSSAHPPREISFVARTCVLSYPLYLYKLIYYKLFNVIFLTYKVSTSSTNYQMTYYP